MKYFQIVKHQTTKFMLLNKMLPMEVIKSGSQIKCLKKTRIRETKNLLTDADSRTDTIFERLHDLSLFLFNGAVDVSTRPLVHASTRRLHAWAMDALHPPPVFRAPRV